MPRLIIDMESVADMMSGLDQLAARVADLATSAEEIPALLADESVYHADLPRASTPDFAEALVGRLEATDVMNVFAAMIVLTEAEPTFCLRQISQVLGYPLKVVIAHMCCLERVEKQLGARLLGSIWSDAENCHFYVMHRDVRTRLASLL
jgi:hypothetical protein